MRKNYQDILRKVFCENLVRSRMKKGFTQAKMAEILLMDDRSYIELDHGKNACGALTLILYLVYVCEDVNEFLQEFRKELESWANDVV